MDKTMIGKGTAMLEFTTVRARIQEIADGLYGDPAEGEGSVNLADLDSFGVVQLILALERDFDLELLEALHGFTGQDFDEFAKFVTASGEVEAPQK